MLEICSPTPASLWEELKAEILAKPGLLLVIGGIDRGKSSLLAWLAKEALKAGLKTALLDADLGQSDIGPPGTIGLAFPQKEFLNYSELSPREIYFVGELSPAENPCRALCGLGRLSLKAREKAELILVNTTGWIEGEAALAFKLAKIDLLKPDYLAALAKEKELEPIISLYRKMEKPRLLLLNSHPKACLRSPELRRANRIKKTAEYFATARELNLELKEVGFSGPGIPALLEGKGQNLLAGLIDAQGDHLGIGIVKNFDPALKRLELLTPVPEALKIKGVYLSCSFNEGAV